MNPAFIVPTYWSAKKYEIPTQAVIASYDHMSSIGSEGELPRLLKSLSQVRGVCRIIIPVVSEPGSEEQAAAKVSAICEQFPNLKTLVIGQSELEEIHNRLTEKGLEEYKDAVMLTGYGSVRNVGLLVAAVLGHTEVIFLDDDEVIDDKDFLEKALYGLGKVTKRGIPVLAKTGFYLNRRGSFEAREEGHWYNHFWRRNELFNKWINSAMKGPRLKPSNSATGGCLALHKEAFKRVAFDPWIARGEDLDYVIDMRMYGFDIWFDNTWSLRHLPPDSPSEALRFRLDIYRWTYERRKIEYLRSQIDLIPVKPRDLEPYPGPFLEANVTNRMMLTAWLRALGLPKEHYFKFARTAHREAEKFAQANCSRYFGFQNIWPDLVASLETDLNLAKRLMGSSDNTHRGITGQFERIESMTEIDDDEAGSAADIADKWAGRSRGGGRIGTLGRHSRVDEGDGSEIDDAFSDDYDE